MNCPSAFEYFIGYHHYNFDKFMHQFQPETKTLIWKLEWIFKKLYRQNVSLLFNQTCINERLLHNYTHTDIYIYIYIYIYCHPQTDCFVESQLFSVARPVGRLKLGWKPAQLYVRLSIIPLSQKANHVSSGISRHYVVAFVCLHLYLTGCQCTHFVRRALHYASGSRKFLRQSAQPP